MRLRIWGRQRLPGQRAAGGGCEIRKRPRPDAREQRGAVGGSFLAIHRGHGQAEDVRLQPTDERAARPTAGQEQAGGSQVDLLQHRQAVAQRKTHAFKHGARHVGTRMGQAQADEGRAQRGVPVGRALPLEVGEKRHALGAGGHAGRFVDEAGLGLIALQEIARDLVTIPGEGAPRRQHDAHHVPDTRRHVTERVGSQSRVDARLGRRGEDRPRRPPAGHRLPRRDRPDAGRPARVVRSATHHRRARGETRERSGLVADTTKDFRRSPHLGQQRKRQADGLEHRTRPAQTGRVEHQGPGRIRRLRGERAREPQPNEILGEKHRGEAGEGGGLVIAQPQNLRKREPLQRGIAHPLAQAGLAASALDDLPTFGRGSPVAPQQRRADHRAAPVEKDRGVHLTGDAHGGDASIGVLPQHAPDGRRARFPPRVRILLRPAGPWGGERERSGRGARDVSRRAHEHRFHGARADVQPEEQRVVHLSGHPAAAPS